MSIVEGTFKGSKGEKATEGDLQLPIPVPETQDPLQPQDLTSNKNKDLQTEEILDFPQVPAFLCEEVDTNPEQESTVEPTKLIDETKLLVSNKEIKESIPKKRRSRTKLQRLNGVTLEQANPGRQRWYGPKKIDIIPKEKIVRSLLRNYGILSEVAIECRCSIANISIRIKNSPELQEWRRLAEERAKDKVETKILKKAIIEEDPMMLRFYAKTKMKDRGYIEDDKRGSPDRPLIIEIVPAGSLPLQDAKEVQFEEVPA